MLNNAAATIRRSCRTLHGRRIPRDGADKSAATLFGELSVGTTQREPAPKNPLGSPSLQKLVRPWGSLCRAANMHSADALLASAGAAHNFLHRAAQRLARSAQSVLLPSPESPTSSLADEPIQRADADVVVPLLQLDCASVPLLDGAPAPSSPHH
jgi:hypothetical protein